MTKTEQHVRDFADRIITMLEAGTRPWVQPWVDGQPSLPCQITGKEYTGGNVLNLWMVRTMYGFKSNHWLTYKGFTGLGGTFKKDPETGKNPKAPAFSFKVGQGKDRKRSEEKGEDVFYSFFQTKAVWNADQIEGLPSHFYGETVQVISEADRIAKAEAFFAPVDVPVEHGCGSAYHRPKTNSVHMPDFVSFRDPVSYYATLAHEMVHATRVESRLNRDFGRQAWGDSGYAMEELVAEIGAAMICCQLGITPEIREDHASYVDHWVKVLKDKPKAIFTAAKHAQAAVDYLSAYSEKQTALAA